MITFHEDSDSRPGRRGLPAGIRSCGSIEQLSYLIPATEKIQPNEEEGSNNEVIPKSEEKSSFNTVDWGSLETDEED